MFHTLATSLEPPVLTAKMERILVGRCILELAETSGERVREKLTVKDGLGG